jgi:hypothetical protein
MLFTCKLTRQNNKKTPVKLVYLFHSLLSKSKKARTFGSGFFANYYAVINNNKNYNIHSQCLLTLHYWFLIHLNIQILT